MVCVVCVVSVSVVCVHGLQCSVSEEVCVSVRSVSVVSVVCVLSEVSVVSVVSVGSVSAVSVVCVVCGSQYSSEVLQDDEGSEHNASHGMRKVWLVPRPH